MSPRRSAEACAVSLGLADEAPDVLAVGGEVADDLVGVDGQVAEDLVLRAEVASTLSVSRRAGLARRIAALRFSALPATPAPSEPMMRLRRSR